MRRRRPEAPRNLLSATLIVSTKSRHNYLSPSSADSRLQGESRDRRLLLRPRACDRQLAGRHALASSARAPRVYQCGKSRAHSRARASSTARAFSRLSSGGDGNDDGGSARARGDGGGSKLSRRAMKRRVQSDGDERAAAARDDGDGDDDDDDDDRQIGRLH